MAAFILLHLLSVERWRQAGAWILMVALCGASIIIIKLLFRSCIMITAAGDISGHTAMSTAVYGGFALLVLSARPVRWLSAVAAAVAAFLVVAIAVSRIALQAHEWGEVVAGLGSGLLALLLFRLVSGKIEGPTRLAGLMVGAAAMAGVLHGAHLPVNSKLTKLAEKFRIEAPNCRALPP